MEREREREIQIDREREREVIDIMKEKRKIKKAYVVCVLYTGYYTVHTNCLAREPFKNA